MAGDQLWMERFVLTDAQWAKMELHCLGKPTDRAAAAVITGALSKRCCGSRGQEVPGAIFRYSSATGTASSSATATG